MKILEAAQGTPQWHAHRGTHHNASDAPAMRGESKYKTRNELLAEVATGIEREFDAETQKRFSDGHSAEALARPLAEQIIGEELYPVTGYTDDLSASFDGLTIGEDIAFEHKSLNDEIRSCKSAADLHPMYRIQMEQQLMVSGARKCLFMASKWGADGSLIEEIHFWYEPDLKLRKEIEQGWAQFKLDLANYKPPEVIPAAVAAPTLALPALSIQVEGKITLVDNLALFGEKLAAFIDGIDKNPSTDQAFADCEAAVKTLEKAQAALEAAESSALAQTASIDEMRRTVALYASQARTTRLMLNKLVTDRKEKIRLEIVQGGKDTLAAHIATLTTRLGKPYMPPIAADFAGAIKGKRTITSLRDAVDTVLAKAKIEANEVADRIQINLNTLRELADNHKFLFADAAQIVLKANDDLTALVKLRIAEHDAAKAKEAEELRVRLEAEARAKVEAENKAAAEQKARDEENAATKASATAATTPVAVNAAAALAHVDRSPDRFATASPPAANTGNAIASPLVQGVQKLRSLIDIQLADMSAGELQQALDALRNILNARAAGQRRSA